MKMRSFLHRRAARLGIALGRWQRRTLGEPRAQAKGLSPQARPIWSRLREATPGLDSGGTAGGDSTVSLIAPVIRRATPAVCPSASSIRWALPEGHNSVCAAGVHSDIPSFRTSVSPCTTSRQTNFSILALVSGRVVLHFHGSNTNRHFPFAVAWSRSRLSGLHLTKVPSCGQPCRRPVPFQVRSGAHQDFGQTPLPAAPVRRGRQRAALDRRRVLAVMAKAGVAQSGAKTTRSPASTVHQRISRRSRAGWRLEDFVLRAWKQGLLWQYGQVCIIY